jgi:hypothetical protein
LSIKLVTRQCPVMSLLVDHSISCTFICSTNSNVQCREKLPTEQRVKQRVIVKSIAHLLTATDSSLVIVCEPRSVNYLDALAEADHVCALPPLGHGMLCGLALLGVVVLVVCVDKAAETGSVAADYNDGLVDPALEVGDVAAAGSTERIDNVGQIGADVSKHVHEAAWLAEGHDHGGVLDEAQGLGVERVPEDVVGAACGERGRVDSALFRVGVDGLELLARCACRRRDGRVGVAEGGSAGARGWAGAEGRGVDEDEELGAAEVGVGEVREDRLWMLALRQSR